MQPTLPKVYIVLVNFNGHLNTIETMESLSKQTFRNFQIIVVDNHTPQSLQRIKDWADGRWEPEFTPPKSIEHLTYPLCAKPVAWVELEVEQAEQGALETVALSEGLDHAAFAHPLIFVQARRDIGFAGGNNVGCRLMLARNDAQYVWLLNNDVVLEPDALEQLVRKAEEYEHQKLPVGIIGSRLRWYRWPDRINAIGGMFNKWTTWSYHLGLNETDHGQYNRDDVRFDYVYGASLFVRADFLRSVGLMNEKYYAYFEEMDWEVRGQRRGWQHGYAWKSVLYHKQGVTTGKEIKSKRRPLFFMCCKYRGWLLFYWYYYPWLIFAPTLRLIGKALKNIAEGNAREAWLILKILLGKRTCTRDMN